MESRNFCNFTDILKERRESSDFMFMSREWNSLPACDHICKTSPAELKKYVIKSPRICYVIEKLSQEDKIPKEILYKNVEDILDEIGLNRQVSVIRVLGLILVKTLKKICSGLYINEKQITKLKSLMGKVPFVFAPSHRSYADFILLAYICFHYDIQFPAVAAGMDFQSMWLMGHVIRDSCAFFMRRSFANDQLYRATFAEYVDKLVTKNDSAIEFFIEGTRSRTAKSLMPKYGFLSMALMPFFSGRVPDIALVPLTISYDRSLEEKLFAYELLGVPKPKESTMGLIKAFKILRENYGNIYVDIAEPISVQKFCGGRLNRSEHAKVPQQMDALSQEEVKLCVELAHHTLREQQKHAVLSPFNLIAVILGNGLLCDGNPILLPEMARDVDWLRSVMETLGAFIGLPYEANMMAVVVESCEVHKCLISITKDNELQLNRVHTTDNAVNISKLKGYNLSQKTMDVAIPIFMLQLYINPCFHYLINPALITVLMMQHLGHSQRILKDELFTKYCFLRSLLSNEFIFYNLWEEKEFEEALAQLETLNIIEVLPSGKLSLSNHRKLQIVFCNLLQPYLVAYLELCKILQQIASEPCAEQKILEATQKRVEELLFSEDISYPYALSLDIYLSTLQSLTTLGVISKVRIKENVNYQTNEDNLSKIINELECLIVQPRRIIQLQSFSSKHLLIQETQAKL